MFGNWGGLIRRTRDALERNRRSRFLRMRHRRHQLCRRTRRPGRRDRLRGGAGKPGGRDAKGIAALGALHRLFRVRLGDLEDELTGGAQHAVFGPGRHFSLEMGGHLGAGGCANRSSGKGAFKPDSFVKKMILSSISIASSHVATDLRFSRTDTAAASAKLKSGVESTAGPGVEKHSAGGADETEVC